MKRWLPLAALIALDVVYRLPGLVHAHDLTSDSTIVGLQAMHILGGEHARFLWGASYQSAFESYLTAALFFLGGGPSSLALSLTSLLGHVVILACAWRVLGKHLDAGKAFALCLLLVVTPQAINVMVWGPPRIWSVAFIFLAIALIELEAPVALAAGVVTAWLGVSIDMFALQVFVPVLIWACLGITQRRHAIAIALGFAAGLVAVIELRVGTRVFGGVGGLTLSHLALNARLFFDHCLAMILSVQAWGPEPMQPPAAWRAWQLLGAGAFVAAIAAAAPLALKKSLPWKTRRLGLLGAGAALASVLGFFLSPMPQDLWAARYLSPIIWLAPLALAPLAAWFTLRGLLAVVLVPYLSVAMVSGLYTWGPLLDLRTSHGAEGEVAAFLRAKHVRYAAAQYWLAYRLTFLFGEEPIVTPLEGTRYAPYREAFDREETVAYLAHPSVPDVTADDLLARLRHQPGTVETAYVAGFTVLVHHR